MVMSFRQRKQPVTPGAAGGMRQPTVQAAFAFGKPLISTWRGNAAAATGAVISSKPLL